VDYDPPVGTSQGLFHFTEGTVAYAGRYLHKWDSPVHTHSFVEIAFAVGGAATHRSLAGRHDMRTGDVILLRPGVWHGYENCQRFEVYNCCFSSELLRRELSWVREDPLLGYLLWAGPYSSAGRGVLTISLHQSAFSECVTHLDALAALRHRPLPLQRADIVGRLSLLFGQLGQAVAQAVGALSGEPGPAHPAVVQAMHLLEADVARSWTLTGLAAELHLAPGYLVRLFKVTTPRSFCCTPTTPSPTSGVRSAGRIKATSRVASRPITGSAPPLTASASPPKPPIFTARAPSRHPNRVITPAARSSAWWSLVVDVRSVAVDCAGGERGQADRDILSAVCSRGAVAHPFTRPGMHALAGLDRHLAAVELHHQSTAQDDRVFVELRTLPGLGPAGWATHVRDADAGVGRIDLSHILVNQLGWLAHGSHPARLADQLRHAHSIH